MNKDIHVTSGDRRNYTAPIAEIVLLAPCERLAAWDFKFHDSNYDDRWVLNDWKNAFGKLNDASGIVGVGTFAELQEENSTF